MKRVYRLIRKLLRAQRIAAISQEAFSRAIRSCANVSDCNRALSYVIHRRGAFGSPEIEQIDRPDVVVMSEDCDYVVVKDGAIFEMSKTKF